MGRVNVTAKGRAPGAVQVFGVARQRQFVRRRIAFPLQVVIRNLFAAHTMEDFMRASHFIYAGTATLAVAVALAVATSSTQAVPPQKPKVPALQFDPNWPKMPLPVAGDFGTPLAVSTATGKPKPWVTGEVAGTCVDSQDHVFTVNRGNLVAPETVEAVSSPTVIEFDSRRQRRQRVEHQRLPKGRFTAASSTTRTTSGSPATATASCRSTRTTARRCCCRSAPQGRVRQPAGEHLRQLGRQSAGRIRARRC